MLRPAIRAANARKGTPGSAGATSATDGDPATEGGRSQAHPKDAHATMKAATTKAATMKGKPPAAETVCYALEALALLLLAALLLLWVLRGPGWLYHLPPPDAGSYLKAT